MTNNYIFLILLNVAFWGVIITSAIGIAFALGAKSDGGKQNNKLSMLISVLKQEVILCSVLSILFVIINSFSSWNSNNFKKEIIKYQQNISAEDLNKYIFLKQHND